MRLLEVCLGVDGLLGFVSGFCCIEVLKEGPFTCLTLDTTRYLICVDSLPVHYGALSCSGNTRKIISDSFAVPTAGKCFLF